MRIPAGGQMTRNIKPALLIVMLAILAACSNSAQQSQTTSSNNAFAGLEVDEALMGKWSRSCALCHVDGEAGAPVVGDSAQWNARLAQGEETVMRNVLEGFNSMPPLGYCMACDIDDFRALIAFMAGTNQ
jgi:cytochrome c5